MTARELRCPASDGPMHQVDRRGVLIDLCRDCKGVFLDRGELDKLLDRASGQGDGGAEADIEGRRRPDRWRDDDDYDQGGRRRRRRGGWLGEIFDN